MHLPTRFSGGRTRHFANRTRPRLAPHMLAASLTLALFVPWVAAQAQSLPHTPATDARQRFSIHLPAAPLDQSLNALAQQTGTQILYAGALAQDRLAPALRGSFTVADALRQLLAGSGLAAQPKGPRTFAIVTAAEASQEAAPMLDEIVVVGRNAGASDLPGAYSGNQVARGSQLGFLGNMDFLDTPFSTQAYTAEYMQNRQAQRLSDVIGLNDPSVEFDRINGYAEQIHIRGFASAAQDITYGGLYGVLPSMRIYPEMAERIEVLKGPSALLNGMMPDGSVGGVINVVPKRAGAQPNAQLTATYASHRHIGGHLDVGKRFGERQQLGLRFNGFYRQGESEIRGQDKHVGLATLGLDWVGDGIRLSADFLSNREKARGFGYWGFYGDISERGVPDTPDPRSFLNSPDSFYRNQDNSAVIRAEADLGEHWLAYFAYGGRSSHFTSLANHIDILDMAGNTSDMWYYWTTSSRSHSGLAGLRGAFRTGPIAHEINISATGYRAKAYDHEETFPNQPTWSSNIYRLDYGPAPAVVGGDKILSQKETLKSIGIADTMAFAGGAFKLTLGVRKQWIDTQDFLWDEAYKSSAVSPSAAAVWNITPMASLYANYSQGLSAGGVAPYDAANAGQVLKPYKTKQYEIGVKFDREQWAGTISLFQIERPSAGYDPVTNVYGPIGDTRNRGLEITTMGEPWRGLRLLGGIAFNHATYQGTAAGRNAGNCVVGVPRTLLKLGAEYDVAAIPGLTLSANLIRSSKQALRNTNTEFVAGWTRVDLGMRYATRVADRPVTFRLEVQNVANKGYWLAPAYNGMGAPRTVLFSSTVHF